MISCKKATEYISKQFEEELSLRERVSLRIHLFICEFCAQFEKQLLIIRTTLKKDPPVEKGKELSSDCKERMVKKILDK